MRGRGGSNNNGGGNNNNNQNRKGPNPLTRSYESNGPDVKIRGSAQQIAEKYTTLARDAQSAGDRVMAENYLQHAEHYNRIIMTAMASMPQPPVRDMRDDEDGDEEGDDGYAPMQQAQPVEQQPQPQQNQQQPRRPRREYQQRDGSGPQPVIEGTPAEVALTDAASVESTASQPQPQPEISEEAPVVVQDVAPSVDAEEAPVRKPRRPRRPRLKSADEAGEEQAASDEAVTEAAQ
jgi:hypothetical protein